MTELVDHVDEQDQVIGTVDRRLAVRSRLLHRVVGIVCRDRRGRILVHRRPHDAPWFSGQYARLIGGGVRAGESYEEAALRELTEELREPAPARFLFKFICHGEIGCPYWFAVHEAVIDPGIVPDPDEIGWFAWMDPAEAEQATGRWSFVTDTEEAYRRYRLTRRPQAGERPHTSKADTVPGSPQLP